MQRFFVRRATVFAVLIVIIGIGGFAYSLLQHNKEPEEVPSVVSDFVEPRPKHEVIGKSVEGRDIDAYTFGRGVTHLLFVGGMHGGYEWNSVLLAYAFVDYFKDHPDAVPADVTVTVIPSINPDGVYKIVHKEGRFEEADIPDTISTAPGRFNAHDVDLNRNFDCNWKPESMWRGNTVSAGSAAFSEPETAALRSFVMTMRPSAVVFWHSQANAVYASECEDGILPETLAIMHAYADAAKYPAVSSFDEYEVTGDAEGWLASIGIPAITVELKTHEDVEWSRNVEGVEALLSYYEHQRE